MSNIYMVTSQETALVYERYVRSFDRSMFNGSVKFSNFLSHIIGSAVPYYLVFVDGDGNIAGALPTILKRGKYGPVLNSMPWFGSNPGIFANNEFAFNALCRAFFSLAEAFDCLTATLISPPYESGFDYDDLTYDVGVTWVDERIGMITPLNGGGLDGLYSIVHQKTRNQIRKGLWECAVEIDNSNEAFAILKQIHKENMQAIGGPVKDKEFDILQKYFLPGHDYNLYLSSYQNNVVAALLIKYYNKTCDYMTPVIRDDYRKNCPLHAAIVTAMLDAEQRGFKYWNWGGTTLPGMEGVYHFKKRFGGQEHGYKYYTKVYKTLPKVDANEFLTEYPYFYVLPFRYL